MKHTEFQGEFIESFEFRDERCHSLVRFSLTFLRGCRNRLSDFFPSSFVTLYFL